MAQLQENTHKTKPRRSSSSCFLGCFGFSRKVPEKEPGSQEKTRRSTFRIQRSDAKTAPVDPATVSVAAKRGKPKQLTPATTVKLSPTTPATLPDQSVCPKPQKTRHEPAQNIGLELHNILDDADSPRDETSPPKRLSFCQKIEAIRDGSSHPGSPEKRSKPRRANTTLYQSISLPPRPPKRKREAGREKISESDTLAGKFDPVVGMSIIMVTLVIMLIGGKLCAILCTSACFYFLPRLGASNAATGSSVRIQNGSNPVDPDLNYEEYKKKVVFEGFLERKHRR